MVRRKVKEYEFKPIKLELEQDEETGEWTVYAIGEDRGKLVKSAGIIATHYLISLWLELQKAKTALAVAHVALSAYENKFGKIDPPEDIIPT